MFFQECASRLKHASCRDGIFKSVEAIENSKVAKRAWFEEERAKCGERTREIEKAPLRRLNAIFYAEIIAFVRDLPKRFSCGSKNITKITKVEVSAIGKAARGRRTPYRDCWTGNREGGSSRVVLSLNPHPF